MSQDILVLDAAKLDADLLAALNGSISWTKVFLNWVAPRPAGERDAMARVISERFHDVFQSWVNNPPSA